MPRRERDLYQYRPEDPSAQRSDAERMKELRDGELRGISEEWDQDLKSRLDERMEAMAHPVAEHQRRRAHRGVIGRLLKRLGLRRSGRRGYRSRRRY